MALQRLSVGDLKMGTMVPRNTRYLTLSFGTLTLFGTFGPCDFAFIDARVEYGFTFLSAVLFGHAGQNFAAFFGQWHF